MPKKLKELEPEASQAENLRLWVAESGRRLKELREGEIDEVPAEEVFRRARAAISRISP
jgi:hypothetical protein